MNNTSRSLTAQLIFCLIISAPLHFMPSLSAMNNLGESEKPSHSYTEDDSEEKQSGESVSPEWEGFKPDAQLQIAIAANNFELASTAVANRADVNTEAFHNISLLAHAMSNNCPDIFKLLLDNSADPNKKNSRNCTILHDAALHENAIYVKILLSKSRQNVNAADVNGDTPLHTATRCDCDVEPNTTDMCKIGAMASLLINAKADLFAKNYAGETPLDQCDRHPLLYQIMWQAHAEQKQQKKQEKFNSAESALS